MKETRKNPPYRMKIRLVQESNNSCAFCNFSDAGRLEFHHIDEDPSNTIVENLIAVCPNCHSSIGEKAITNEEVIARKQELQKKLNMKEDKNSTKIKIKDSTLNNPVIGNDNTVNITVKKQVTKKIVEKYPEGSIGRDVLMYGYAKRMADRYADYKNYDLKKKGEVFNYSSFYKKVMNDFRAGGYFHIPQTRFLELVEYLQKRIDGTVLGKINKSKGTKNYSTFEEYKLENE